MVGHDSDPCFYCKFFEVDLCSNCLIAGKSDLVFDMNAATGSITEDSSTSVRLLCSCSIFVLCRLARYIHLILIAEDYLTWLENILLQFTQLLVLDMLCWVGSSLLFAQLTCAALDIVTVCVAKVLSFHSKVSVLFEPFNQLKVCPSLKW